MKAKNLISMLSLGILLAGLSASVAKAAGPIISATQVSETNQVIIYVVNIEHTDHLAGFTCKYYVGITDPRGNEVVPPQPFREGKWTYIFEERAITFTGTRIAHMVSPNKFLACEGELHFAPLAMTATFKTGQDYLFDLAPMPAPGPVSEASPGIK